MATSSGGERVTVFLSNVPLSVTEDRIADLINERRGEVEGTWRLQSDDKMLVRIVFLEEAGMIYMIYELNLSSS